jgi:hypothetical protein
MRDSTGINGVNRYTFEIVPTARFAEVAFLKRLADVNLKSVALKETYNGVRIFYRDNYVIPIDVDQP